MRARSIAVLLLASLCCLAQPAAPPLSLPQYVGALGQLRQSVTATTGAGSVSSLIQNLPAAWGVAANGREFTVPSDSVRQALSDYAKQYTPAHRDAVTAQLDLLLRDAHAMQATQTNFSADHNRLAGILSRREFAGVEGETWYDRAKHAVQRWLWHLIERVLTSSAYPAVGRVVIWGLLALAVAVVAFWIVRLYRETNIYTQFAGAPNLVSAKPWRDWQAEAQAAAEAGRWRDAVHLLYWAGISFLEAQGLWRPDLARTPREYLRLLPAGDSHRAPLVQLTRSFEKVWYGNDVATAQTFAGAAALLEQLGCR